MPLFYISAEYDHPNLNFQPPLQELDDYLKKFKNNINESAMHFARWKDGNCTFCDEVKGQNDEKEQKHTFKEQII